MTTATITTSNPKPRQGINWPPAIAAIILLLLLVGGVGYIMWDSTGFGQKSTLNDYEHAGDGRDFRRMDFRRFEQPPVAQFDKPVQGSEQIIRRNDKRYAVMSPGVSMDANYVGGSWQIQLRYDDWRVFSPESRQAMGAWLTATERANEAASAKVTPDQLAKLKELKVNRDMVAASQAISELTDLWNTYINTSADKKKSAANPVFEKLREIAKSSLPGTIEAVNKASTDIRAILSQEQIDQLRPQRNRRQ